METSWSIRLAARFKNGSAMVYFRFSFLSGRKARSRSIASLAIKQSAGQIPSHCPEEPAKACYEDTKGHFSQPFGLVKPCSKFHSSLERRFAVSA
jgi:hypothetical protein